MTALDDVTAADAKLPFHLRGNYAPVMEEVEAFDLPVIGSIPPELQGTYIRNGANPKHGPTMHWFAGDGMLHGVRLRDGRADDRRVGPSGQAPDHGEQRQFLAGHVRLEVGP